jgi:NAD(P)-dependent dehydrogenase (short-subunit alcohol dehydrogenase family)
MQSDSNRFEGRVAFVTGAGTGIGRATALRFASEGAAVAVVGVVDADNCETVRRIEAAGGRALAIPCDVTDSDGVRSALQQTVDAYGGLDIAFNNAGIMPAVSAPLADLREPDWDRVIEVNLRGVFVCMRHQIPLLLERGGGAIVNTSSAAGVKGFAHNAAYVASKHGVIGLTRAAALDYAASNVRINAICPGMIDSEMFEQATGNTPEARAAAIALEPIGRMGRPEEIAAAVAYLCSDEASFAVGHALIVDGGQTI